MPSIVQGTRHREGITTHALQTRIYLEVAFLYSAWAGQDSLAACISGCMRGPHREHRGGVARLKVKNHVTILNDC